MDLSEQEISKISDLLKPGIWRAVADVEDRGQNLGEVITKLVISCYLAGRRDERKEPDLTRDLSLALSRRDHG